MGIKSLILALIVLFLFTVLGVSTPKSSGLSADNLTLGRVPENTSQLLFNSSTPEPELPRGVPYVVHLSYENGSFLSTGPVDYLIKFDFGEPFIISALKKGTFDNATLIENNTAVKFHSGPISKGENKTGVLLFSFEDGLAEKHRVANITTNVTVHSLPEKVKNIGLINSNSTGTFANASLFSNETLFNAIIGAQPEPVIPNFVNSLPINSLRSGLANLSLPEIAGTFHALPPDRADLLVNSIPPIAPSKTISNSSSFVVNSSYIDLISSIVNLTNGILELGEKAYTEISPCLSLSSITPFDPQDIPGALLYKFGIKIKNCSNHFELVRMTSEEDPVSSRKVFDISRFDMTSNETKKLNLYALIPNTKTPGFYTIALKGDALWSGFGLEAIVAETLGEAPLVVVPPP